MPTVVECPNCKTAVAWAPENKFRPFCSERCKRIDLGAWAAGDYAIPVQANPLDDALDIDE